MNQLPSWRYIPSATSPGPQHMLIVKNSLPAAVRAARSPRSFSSSTAPGLITCPQQQTRATDHLPHYLAKNVPSPYSTRYPAQQVRQHPPQ
jgi:hypothetical protein